MRLEALEDRLAPATIPTPEVGDLTNGAGFIRDEINTLQANPNFGAGVSPVVMRDPLNANKLAAVWSTGTRIGIATSRNDGSTWENGTLYTDGIFRPQITYVAPAPPTNPQGALRDPTTLATTFFPAVSHPSLAWDSNEQFYVLYETHDAGYTNGALVMFKIDFTSNTPTNINLPAGAPADPSSDGMILQRWYQNEPIFNPTISADSNFADNIDPNTGAVSDVRGRDTMVGKTVYVAWNTNTAASTRPYGVRIMGSQDGGLNWTTPVWVTDGGPITSANVISMPQILFTQPSIDVSYDTQGNLLDGVEGGHLVVGFANQTGNIITSTSRPDHTSPNIVNGNAGTVQNEAAVGYNFRNDTGGGIPDAITIPNSSPRRDQASVRLFPITVSITDTNFTTVSDLDVQLALTSPNLNQLSLVLITPQNERIPLVRNRQGIDSQGNAADILDFGQNVRGLGDTTYLGAIPLTDDANVPPSVTGVVGAIFDQEASLRINEGTGFLTGRYRPEATLPPGLPADPGDFYDLNQDVRFATGAISVNGFGIPDETAATYPTHTLAQIYGRARTSVNGTWNLEVTDWVHEDPANTDQPQRLLNWNLRFSSIIDNNSYALSTATLTETRKTAFGTDRTSSTASVVEPNNGALSASVGLTNAVNGDYPTKPAVNPVQGLGPTFSLAQDKSLGEHSLFQGRVYLADTRIRPTTTTSPLRPDDYNVYLRISDNGGVNWFNPDFSTFATPINDDGQTYANSSDQIMSEGNRAQFMPTVTVDPTTGTLVAMWYDARWDAARARAATYIATSIDGGETWSGQTFLNEHKLAFDTAAQKEVVLEPMPGNLGQTDVRGFGDYQSLSAWGGRVIPFFASNRNAAGSLVYTTNVRITAGPRVIKSDMGEVIQAQQAFVDDGTVINYNNTFAADGTRQLTGFQVTFDRPVDVASFTPDDITVLYRSPNTPASAGGTPVPVANIIPLDSNTTFGARAIGGDGSVATQFFIQLTTPQSGVGTYSYSIGTHINDLVPTRIPNAVGSTAKEYFSNDVPQTFGNPPFPPTITSVLNVPPDPADPVITDLDVSLKINHHWDRDVVATLIAPNGTRILLFQQLDINNTGDNFHGANQLQVPTVLDDEAGIAINDPNNAFPPYAGSFRPMEALTAVDGLSPTGLWKLELSDVFKEDESIEPENGQLLSWSLRITTTSGTVIFKMGNEMDQDANGTENEVSDTYAVPAPTTGTPFQLPYTKDTLPLIVPGPHIVNTGISPTPALQRVVYFAKDTPLDFGGQNPTFPSTVDSVITVPNNPGALIRDIKVNVHITHTHSSDVTISLISPNGTVVTLASGLGGATVDAYADTSFADSAGTAITAATAPFSGTFRPEELLSAFNGVEAQGDWTLEVSDTNPSTNDGQLVDWSLEVTTLNDDLSLNNAVGKLLVAFDRDIDVTTFGEVAVPNSLTRTGTVGAAGADIVRITTPAPLGDVGGTYSVTPLNSFVSGGKTLARIFEVTLPTILGPTGVPQSFSEVGTYQVIFGSDISDRFGNKLDNNFNAGLDVLRGGDPVNSPTVDVSASSAASPQVPIAVPPNRVVSVPIVVTDDFAIADLNVRLTIQHNNDPDLAAVLIAPDNTQIALFNSVGTGFSQPRNFTNTLFDDSAPRPIQGSAPPFSLAGGYTPQTPLSSVIGHSAHGTWQLVISNSSTTNTGLVTQATLQFKKPVTITGLGELVADQYTANFRIFNQDPTSAASRQNWTELGPAVDNGSDYTQDITAVSVDPSDPSGNTVFIGSTVGGVWRTTNFLTSDANGPSWQPLIDLGLFKSMSIGSLLLMPRNNDPRQTIVLVGTGDGNSSQQGVGFLRSTDAGNSWQLIDSTTNFGADGVTELPLNSASRDHVFNNQMIFQIIADPNLTASGDNIVYAAVSGTNGGVYRSMNSGKSWALLRAGQATSVALSQPRFGTETQLQRLYAGFKGTGGGVYFSNVMGNDLNDNNTLRTGGGGNPLVRDPQTSGTPQLPVQGNPAPNGVNGRVTLATPALTKNPFLDFFYQGWVYAMVTDTSGFLLGLFASKDYGLNWTKVELGTTFKTLVTPLPQNRITTNDENRPSYNPLKDKGMKASSLAVDPNDPRIVYIGGDKMLRVDMTKLEDPYSLVGYNNSNNDGGKIQFQTDGAAGTGWVPSPPFPPIGEDKGILDTQTGAEHQGSFLNLYRDPFNPLVASQSTILTYNYRAITGPGGWPMIPGFRNTGWDAEWRFFPADLDPSSDLSPANVYVIGADDRYRQAQKAYHQILTTFDPTTGQTRLLIARDNGIYTSVDAGGMLQDDIGTHDVVAGIRTGNLRIARLTQGAAQPSALSAALTDALFYASTANYGFPRSNFDILTTGNQVWKTFRPQENTDAGGVGIETDPTGSGVVWRYRFPSVSTIADPANNTGFPRLNGTTDTDLSEPVDAVALSGGPGVATDFLQITNGDQSTFGRTGSGANSLVQAGDQPFIGQGQWPIGPSQNSRFAINPYNTLSLAISSAAGRVFRTRDQGLTWFPIGEPSELDGTYGQAIAFGAPEAGDPESDNVIYVGTVGSVTNNIRGHVYVTFDGSNFTSLDPMGLDGTAVQQLIVNPQRGARQHQLYVVTQNHVYFMEDAHAVNPKWIDITGNLFSLTANAFGKAAYNDTIIKPFNTATGRGGLTSIVGDWRTLFPDNPANPLGRVHPVLYVAADGGVFRSVTIRTGTNQTTTWRYFPNVNDDGAAADGGLMPRGVKVTDLYLSVGAFDQATQKVDEGDGFNTLLAVTDGRSAYAIRLPASVAGLISGSSGPVVASALPEDPNAGTMSSVIVTWEGPIDPQTFTAADVVFTDTDGVVIPITNIEDITPEPAPGEPNLHNVYRLSFAPQTKNGAYKMTIGPLVSSVGGALMNQTQDGVNGDDPSDTYTARFYRNSTANGPFVPVVLTRIVSDPSNALQPGNVVAEYSDGVNGYQRVLWDIMPPTATWVNVTAADVNADGFTDYFGRILETGEWWVALSTSSGNSFAVSRWATWDRFTNWQNVVTGDFNGDGKTDIAGRNPTTGDWMVGLSNGSGFVSTKWGNWSPALTYVDTRAADFTGDGLIDVAARDPNSGNWWVSVSNGVKFSAPTVWTAWAPGGATTWVDVLTGDFNGDGKQDIAGRYASTGQWRVNLANVTGTAFTSSIWATGATGWAAQPPNAAPVWVDVMAADFNNDGKTDLIGRFASSGDWWVSLANAGGSAFIAPKKWVGWTPNPGGGTWIGVNVGDFTGDGLPDIAGMVSTTGQWWVAKNNGGAQTFTNQFWNVNWNPAINWSDIRVGDIDGDGKKDVIGRNPLTGQGLWNRSNTAGTAFEQKAGPTLMPSNITWVDAFAHDFNGDGKDDYAARILESGQWFVSLNNGNGGYRYAPWATWSPAVTWVDVLSEDFNGDGKADITGRVLQTGQLWTSLSNGKSFDTSLWGNFAPSINWVFVRNGDFNGDGKMDIVGRDPTTGNWWLGRSTGASFVNQLWGNWTPAVQWSNVLAADFTGDGKTDIAGRESNGNWWVQVSNAAGTGSQMQFWQLNWSPAINFVDVAFGDFNGDGRADIIGRNLATGQWNVGLSQFTGGSNKFVNSIWATWSPSANWVNVLVPNPDTDFNGDGKTDIYGREFGSGTMWVGLADNTNHFNTTLWDTFLPGATTNNARVGRRS